MAIFGYGRISTTQQETENQRIEIERAGYSLDYWFVDTVSGKTCASERPQFQQMLQRVRDGETILVSKLDRIGRDAQDVLSTVKMLGSRNIRLVVLQLGTVDLTSPAGKLLLTMLSAVAEMERDLLIERTQAGLTRAKAQGKKLGRIPKTTTVQRDQIRSSYAQGETVSSLSRAYNISRASILNIVNPA